MPTLMTAIVISAVRLFPKIFLKFSNIVLYILAYDLKREGFKAKHAVLLFSVGSKQNTPFYFLWQELQLAIVVFFVIIFVLGSAFFGMVVVVPVFALLNTSVVSIGLYIYKCVF